MADTNGRQLTPAQWRQVNNLSRGQATEAEIERAVRAEIRKAEKVNTNVRCRICRDPEALRRANMGLANGMTYDAIFWSLEEVNKTRPKNSKITYRILLTHARDHFDLTSPAQAVYRRMLERRMAEQEELKVEGATTVVTTLGYLEVMGQKGFETLVKDDTRVTPEAGMQAMLKLHELTEGSNDLETAELRNKVAALGTAVRDIVPPELWSKILDRMDEISGGVSLSATTTVEVQEQIEDEPYDPVIDYDEDDTLED